MIGISRRHLFAGFVLLIAAVSPLFAETKVVGYVPNWIDLASFAESIDYAMLTHLNVAFENPVDAEGNLSFNQADEALISRAHTAGRKVLVSIGGGAAANDPVLKPRYFSLLGDANRARFVAKLSEYVASHHFDGLDVDIEGPSINKDYGAFITELSAVLRPNGKLLTAALSEGYGGKNVPDVVLQQFDWVNVMAYDATGPWNPKHAGQHSSVDLARSSVDYWTGRGLSKEKVVLGVPFFGYGFGEAFRTRDYPYAEIVSSFPGAEASDEAGSTVWYNGIPTIRAKVRLVKQQGLGGIMIWSLNLDTKGEKSLLSAIHDELTR